MTSLRQLLGIEVRISGNRYRTYKVAGQTIAEFNPYRPSTCFDFESDGIFEHVSDFEEWFTKMLTQQFSAVLPAVLAAGKSRPYQPRVYLPFYMHYDRPRDEEADCE